MHESDFPTVFSAKHNKSVSVADVTSAVKPREARGKQSHVLVLKLLKSRMLRDVVRASCATSRAPAS